MKRTLLTLTLAAAALMAGACSADQDMATLTAEPTGSPTPQATMEMPMTTDSMLPDAMEDMLPGGGMTDAPQPTFVPEATGVISMDKARRVVEQLEEELERLSEVDDAEVIIAGNKAAVALEFDDRYRGGVDERLRSIIKERIDGVISGISTIAVTADEAIMDTIESLGDQLDSAADISALQKDLDAVISRIQSAGA